MAHYKATFVRKYYGHGYDAHMVYLDYTYRGHEYTVEESSRAAGSNAAIMILGFTQQEVADKVGCTQSQVADWSSGKRYPHEENIEKLETLLINPAMRLELGQTQGLMHGMGEVE